MPARAQLRATSAMASVPASGTDVLARMHAAYDGDWYATLTFVQTTILHRPDGSTNTQTWRESIRYTPDHGGQLRIDVGDLDAGNGMLYTADSAWVMRGGALARVQPSGNEFLPLIENVYMQTLARTVRELAVTKVDLSKVRRGEWRGRPVWVVGTTAADTTSPQFWVDVERNVVVRFLLHPEPSAPVLDVLLDGYERVGKAWLATQVRIHSGGRLVQEERYADWKIGMPLDPALFDITRWTSAPHWGRGRSPF
jgi:hypothetical protein